MKKLTKALAIVATVIYVLSLMGVLVTGAIQTIDLYSQSYMDVVEIILAIPLGTILNLLVYIVVSGLLCFTLCAKRGGIWSEIIAIVLLVGAAPCYTLTIDLISLAEYLFETNISNSWFNVFYDYNHYLMYSFATTFIGVATSLLLVACGMSIAYKHLTRKQEKALSTSSGEQIFPDAVQNP